jgi:hypothetical protein
MTDRVIDGNPEDNLESDTAGGFISAGVGYMFTDNIGIGINIQSPLGNVKKTADQITYERKTAGIGGTLGIIIRF